MDTLEDQQSTRNRQLMRFAEDLHLVENRGSGINTILNEMRKVTMEPPIFEDTRSAFLVAFYNRHLLEPNTLAWLDTFAVQPLNE
jgi:predicted HTH transcriptional regulator